MSNAGLSPGNEHLPILAFQDVRVGTIDGGEAGVLVLRANQLVAVLTHVDEEVYAAKGKWFLEIGFGRLNGRHRLFQSLDEAKAWIEQCFSSNELTLAVVAPSVAASLLA
jgi:hypothetical protein